MQKIRFITNPFSGTRSKANLEATILNHLDLNKFSFEIWYTQYAGHAKELSEEAVRSEIDIVVAVGGDGTVNEVASALVNTETILAVLPYGSGNGFAMHSGVGRNPVHAIKIINSGGIKYIDTCLANDMFFVNIAGLGLDATVAYKTKMNKRRGFLPYFLATLKESLDFKYMDMEIETESETFKGSYAMVVVANASIYGYNFAIVPEADLQDGLMDVLLVVKKPVFRYFLMAFRMFNRTFHKSPLVKTYKVKQISITNHSNAFIHVDGEGFKADKTTVFKVIPSSLKVIFPK